MPRRISIYDNRKVHKNEHVVTGNVVKVVKLGTVCVITFDNGYELHIDKDVIKTILTGESES